MYMHASQVFPNNKESSNITNQRNLKLLPFKLKKKKSLLINNFGKIFDQSSLLIVFSGQI
jgi:hypothetical protein